jgi:hypothetical protein
MSYVAPKLYANKQTITPPPPPQQRLQQTKKQVYFAFRGSNKHAQANAEISRIALKAAAGHHGVRL